MLLWCTFCWAFILIGPLSIWLCSLVLLLKTLTLDPLTSPDPPGIFLVLLPLVFINRYSSEYLDLTTSSLSLAHTIHYCDLVDLSKGLSLIHTHINNPVFWTIGYFQLSVRFTNYSSNAVYTCWTSYNHRPSLFSVSVKDCISHSPGLKPWSCIWIISPLL